MNNKSIIYIIILLVINIGLTAFLMDRLDTQNIRINQIKNLIEDYNNGVKSYEDEINDLSTVIEQISTKINSKTYSALAQQPQQSDDHFDVYVTIWLDDENHVHRTGVESNVTNLSWVLMLDGKVILEKNCLFETEYEYYRDDPGTYVFYVESFIDGGYKVVSNEVTYTIEGDDDEK